MTKPNSILLLSFSHPLYSLSLTHTQTSVGGCVAEEAADRLYETQKENAATLLKMIKEYCPQGSGVVWGKLTPTYIYCYTIT